MGSHVCLPSRVPHASTVLSKHGVGVEPLFLPGFLGPFPCLRKGGGRGMVEVDVCCVLFFFYRSSVVFLSLIICLFNQFEQHSLIIHLA